jgi:hypothetical protein
LWSGIFRHNCENEKQRLEFVTLEKKVVQTKHGKINGIQLSLKAGIKRSDELECWYNFRIPIGYLVVCMSLTTIVTPPQVPLNDCPAL